MKTYINQYKQFSKLKKSIAIIALLQLFGFTIYGIYAMNLHASLLESILLAIYIYSLFIIMPYYNYICLNQTIFYLTEEDCYELAHK
jgi:hypothetical protein